MGSRVEYYYEVPACVDEYIKGDPLFVEFPMDVSAVPESVLTIPFCGVFSTICILLNVNISVPCLDKQFYYSMLTLKEDYKKLFDNNKLEFGLTVEHLVENHIEGEKCSLFFTSGVDASSALAQKYSEKPILINIWGGDVRLTDHSSHEELVSYFETFTKNIGLQYFFVKTNGRETFKENELEELCERLLGHKNNHGWWASIAHILVMVSAIAPIMYEAGITKHYIGSSYDENNKTFDANNERMIADILFANMKCESVDSNVNRNQKVKSIIEWNNNIHSPLELKVCWQRINGKNCNNCEKCYRTIMNILSNGGNPNEYGFAVNDDVIHKIHAFLLNNLVSEAFWIPIQNTFKTNESKWKNDKRLNWILTITINSPRIYIKKGVRKLLRILKVNR